jgi:hypothetical protein
MLSSLNVSGNVSLFNATTLLSSHY